MTQKLYIENTSQGNPWHPSAKGLKCSQKKKKNTTQNPEYKYVKDMY